MKPTAEGKLKNLQEQSLLQSESFSHCGVQRPVSKQSTGDAEAVKANAAKVKMDTRRNCMIQRRVRVCKTIVEILFFALG